MIIYSAMQGLSRSVFSNCSSSTLQPLLRIRKYISISHRHKYHCRTSAACSKDSTAMLVSSTHSTCSTPLGGCSSLAKIPVIFTSGNLHLFGPGNYLVHLVYKSLPAKNLFKSSSCILSVFRVYRNPASKAPPFRRG